jgi:hypothetical protein
VLLVYRVAGEPRSASWTFDPPRRLVQAVDAEARALIGEAPPEQPEQPEPSFPFVPRIARLPRDRPADRQPSRDGRGERSDRGERDGRPDRDQREEQDGGRPAEKDRDSLTSLLEAVPNFRGDMVVPALGPAADSPDSVPAGVGGDGGDGEEAAEESAPPAASAGAGSAYADILMPRSVGAHRERLTGTTDRQAEADGVRPGRRATVPSWDEIVFGSRRKKQE